MMTISDTTTVVVADDVLASELGAEFVMLNLKDGIYYGLEDVGGEIWKLVQTPITVGEICRALVADYDVEPERCQRDVMTLLGDLLARGLLQIRNPA